MNSPDLFDDSFMSSSGSEPSSGRLILPTNRYNLVHFSSLGLVAPRESFDAHDNYYEDLLSLAPGRLPLFRPPLGKEIAEWAMRESQTALPVLLEIDPGLNEEEIHPALDAEGNPAERPISDPDVFAVAPRAVLPFRSVKRLHFLTEEARKRFLVQPFENAPALDDDDVRVTPDLASGGPLGEKDVLSWLGRLEKPSEPTGTDYRATERIAGSFAVIAHAYPDLRSDLLSLYRTGTHADSLPDWFRMSDSAPDDGAEEGPDRRIFRSVAELVREIPPNEWRPLQLLRTVRERCSGRDLGEHRGPVESALEKLERIVANEAEYEPPTTAKYPPLQGLLLFLIREKPEDLLDWSPDETGASSEAHLAAAAYSGLLRGLKRLPRPIKDPDFIRPLTEAAAARLSHASLQVRPEESPGEAAEDVGLADILLEHDLKQNGPHRSAAVRLCEVMSQNARDPEDRDGWKSCVRTELFSPDRDEVSMRVTQKGGANSKYKMAWIIPGVARPQYHLDVDLFKEQLQSADLPRDVENALRSRLDAELSLQSGTPADI